MDKVVSAGADTSVTFEWPTSIVPVTLSYRVVDEDETQIVAWTAVTPPGGQVLDVTIPGSANVLGAGIITGYRAIVLKITTATGEHVLTEDYVLEAPVSLAVMVNSFQTIGQAKITRAAIPDLPGWDAGTDDSRSRAMRAAFQNLKKMKFRYQDVRDVQSLLNSYGPFAGGEAPYYVPDISLYTPEEYAELPLHFRTALQRAQVVEADSLLGGNPVEGKRNDGIVSETIGESSIFFGARAKLKTSICEAAMRELKGYLYTLHVLERV